MRAALMSDIHGNTLALEAVLTDIEGQGGVDEHWVLGDFVALGPDPVGVLERLSALPGLRVVRGNTERYVCTGDRPAPSQEEALGDRELVRVLAEVAGTFAWTLGAVTQAGWLKWLSALPLELRVSLPDGTRFLGVHAAPGTDDGWGMHPDYGVEALEAMLVNCEAELVCVGHTHFPFDIEIAGRRLVNLGSVSNPRPEDLRASYVMLEADNSGFRLWQRRVNYDREAVVTSLERMRHPGGPWIIRQLLGQGFQGGGK